MPDEISHLLWTYLLLKHPRIQTIKELQSKKNIIATYFFTILPDLSNLALIIAGIWVMIANGIPLVPGPSSVAYPEVREVFNGPLRNVYYVFHSYVTYALLLLIAYILLRRIYWPLLIGMGLGITLDIPTHKDMTALKPFYPLLDTKINGIVHWGSWEFYIAEILLIAAYTFWLYKKNRQNQETKQEK